MIVIANLVYNILGVLSWMIVIKALLTWFPDRGGRVQETLSSILEPIEAPIRDILYRYNTGPVDFTSMVLLIIIMLLRSILLSAM